MTTEAARLVSSPLVDRGSLGTWPAVLLFWSGVVAAGLLQGKMPWLALSTQLWVSYSTVSAALWWLTRQKRVVQSRRLWMSLAGSSLLGAALSLPLAPDFVVERLASAQWLAQRGALPWAFALALHLPGMLWRLRTSQRLQQQLATAEQAAALATLSRQLTLAELKTLQAQVEPHFLYNTLASVQYLVRHQPALAEQMLDHLHRYLRMALPAMRAPSSTLGHETALAGAYLAIMQIRLGGRLRYRIDLPATLADHVFPPMMLATLVENAVQHGIEPQAAGGQVTISSRLLSGALELTVSDDGVGLVEASTQPSGNGMGLANVSDRLRSLYGERASLTVEAAEPSGVRACIILPSAMGATATVPP